MSFSRSCQEDDTFARFEMGRPEGDARSNEEAQYKREREKERERGGQRSNAKKVLEGPTDRGEREERLLTYILHTYYYDPMCVCEHACSTTYAASMHQQAA